MVWSNLEYSVTVWEPHYTKDIMALDKFQRQAARFVVGDYSWDSSVSNMLKELEWNDLTDRRREATLVMFYKIVNGLVAVEANNYLTPGSVHTHSSNNLKYRQIQPSIHFSIEPCHNGIPYLKEQ